MAGLHIHARTMGALFNPGADCPILQTPNLYQGNPVVKWRLKSPATRSKWLQLHSHAFFALQDKYQNHISGSHDDSISWLVTMYYKTWVSKVKIFLIMSTSPSVQWTSVVLCDIEWIVIHNFPYFFLQNRNNFCRHKQVGLIQILNHKLSAQSYFLIEVKKKLLYCRIAIREKILKYVNLWCYQAKRTLIQRQPKDRGITKCLLAMKYM